VKMIKVTTMLVEKTVNTKAELRGRCMTKVKGPSISVT
jgi:hypothetical protein